MDVCSATPSPSTRLVPSFVSFSSTENSILKSRFPDINIPGNETLTQYVTQHFDDYGNDVTIINGVTGESYTYLQLQDSIRRVGSALTRMGFKQHDVLAFFSPNVPEYAIAFFGVASVGEYLGKVDQTDFFKVRVTGPMTNDNVKTSCEKVGMRFPCFSSGYGGCSTQWASECVSFDASDVSCRTLDVLSSYLCGTSEAHNCQPLDDIFVHHPHRQDDDSAWGVDHDPTHLIGGGCNC
ncbi:Hypp6466 [Branchiostoma lanceolatum]|uniref:Hypp6466 protein n=1 Tax=Branchiostoma lanceolatum TaxID=7740 RepID=A0A8J9YUV2_BRALA|nr:Hypp6466 [Branchiostoma lanceolatum]